MKKLLSIFILIVMMSSFVLVYAETPGIITHNPVVSEKIVAISGTTTQASDLPITLKVVNESGVTIFVDQVLINESNGFTFVVASKDMIPGNTYTYLLHHLRMVNNESLPFTESGTFYVPSVSDEQNVVGAFSDLEGSIGPEAPNRIQAMDDFLRTPLNAQILNLDLTALDNLENPDAVVEGMCDAYASLTSLELISAKFAELVATQAAKEENAREVQALIAEIKTVATLNDLDGMLTKMETNAAELNIKTAYGFATIQSELANGDNASALVLKNAIAGTTTPEEFSMAVANVTAAKAFDVETWGKFDDIESYYNEYIGYVFADARATLQPTELTDLQIAMQSAPLSDINAVKDFIRIKTQEIVNARHVIVSNNGGVGTTIVHDSRVPIVSQPNTEVLGFVDCEHLPWAKESILRLKAKGIVNGKSATHFNPDDQTTREEYLKMLLSACDIQLVSDSDNNFTDVQSGAWYAPYVATAVKLGIVTGISDTEFGIGMHITRQDMAVLTFRMLQHLNKLQQTSNAHVFADAESFADYAKESINAMQSLGVIKGMDDNRFEPLMLANRAQTAVIIDRVMNLQ